MMVFSISTVIDDFLDGLGDVLLHLEGLAEGGQRVLPFVFAVQGFLHFMVDQVVS